MEVDPPPPYTAHYHVERSSPSTVASLSSTRSSSLSLPPVEDSKNTIVQARSNAPEEQVQTQQLASSSATWEKPNLENAMRAQAPLEIIKKNKSIDSDLLVLYPRSGQPKSADMSLQTKNAKIASKIYVEDTDWGRPFTIEANTKNSSLSLAVHTLRPGQAVDIQASTKNGSASLLLPPDFTGLLIMSTTNAKEALSARLQKVATIVPTQLSGTGDSDHEMCYEINGSSKPSRAVLKTKNGSIGAGFVGDEEEMSRGSCLVM